MRHHAKVGLKMVLDEKGRTGERTHHKLLLQCSNTHNLDVCEMVITMD